MKSRWKCECGAEYDGFRYQCPACHMSCERAKRSIDVHYVVEAYVEDENLEKILNKFSKNRFSLVRWFRNEPTSGGTENSTLVFKKWVYDGDLP